jgi:1,4-alpha-glucan branching enzyme
MWHGRPASAVLQLPPSGVLWLAPEPSEERPSATAESAELTGASPTGTATRPIATPIAEPVSDDPAAGTAAQPIADPITEPASDPAAGTATKSGDAEVWVSPPATPAATGHSPTATEAAASRDGLPVGPDDMEDRGADDSSAAQ